MDNVAKNAKIQITLMGGDRSGIRISRNVIKTLGWPTYVCFLNEYCRCPMQAGAASFNEGS